MASAASFEVLTDLVDADLNCDGAVTSLDLLPVKNFYGTQLP